MRKVSTVPKKKPISVKQVDNPNDRKTAAYWMSEDNLTVLTGLSLQCRTLEELASILNVHTGTLKNWRVKHPDIKEAIDIGREQADAIVVNSTFADAVNADGQSRRLWWQYRIGPKEETYHRANAEAGIDPIGQAAALADMINKPRSERTLPGRDEDDGND